MTSPVGIFHTKGVDIAVVDGGTGASNAAAARANLGAGTGNGDLTTAAHAVLDHTGIPGVGGGSSGKLIQQVRSSRQTFLSTATIIPYDNSIPQISEGVEVLTASITPVSTSNFLVFQFNGTLAHPGNNGASEFNSVGSGTQWGGGRAAGAFVVTEVAP